MDIKDNREEMRNKPREVCRVCGSKEVHTQQYNNATMACVAYLRVENARLNGIINQASTIIKEITEDLNEQSKPYSFLGAIFGK